MKCMSHLLLIFSLSTAACSGVELAPPDMSPQEIAAIDLADAHDDNGWVAPVSAGLAHLAKDPARKAELDALLTKLALWPPAQDPDPAQRVTVLLNAIALVDLGRGSCEGEFAWAIFDRLLHAPERAAIMQATAHLAAGRDSYTPVINLLPLGLTTTETTERVHARMALYARKLLGRFLGSLATVAP